MKPSNNNSVVAGFVSWSQDKLLMKLLDTLFKMAERNSRFRLWKVKIVRVK